MSDLVVKIFDLASNELADISPIALEKSMQVQANGRRTFTVQTYAGHSLLTAAAGDGFPKLESGDRKLLVWEDGTIIHHGRIFTDERTGDGSKNRATITSMDPVMELGYDGNDQAGRPVRDSTGNFIDPSFDGTGSGGAGVITGPDLIYQMLTNSQNADPTLGEGPLPIDLTTGTFDLDIPPATDMSPSDSMDYPKLVGDFIQQLVQTGLVDLVWRPVDPAESLDPYAMVALSAVTEAGTDKSGMVHFDYWTGAKNAAACRYVDDFTTVNNKPFFYLGPRIDKEHWRANIAPDSPGVNPDPADSRARYGGPDGGQFMSISVHDGLGDEASSRPLYLALFNAELGYRLYPRKLLYITPARGSAALFDAPSGFDIFDKVGVNTGGSFGVAFAEAQRVMGYTKTWTRQNVPSLSQIVTTADVSLG